jgi:hypothetical protein
MLLLLIISLIYLIVGISGIMARSACPVTATAAVWIGFFLFGAFFTAAIIYHFAGVR